MGAMVKFLILLVFSAVSIAQAGRLDGRWQLTQIECPAGEKTNSDFRDFNEGLRSGKNKFVLEVNGNEFTTQRERWVDSAKSACTIVTKGEFGLNGTTFLLRPTTEKALRGK